LISGQELGDEVLAVHVWPQDIHDIESLCDLLLSDLKVSWFDSQRIVDLVSLKFWSALVKHGLQELHLRVPDQRSTCDARPEQKEHGYFCR
jgi:hypothetical protein